MGDLFAYGMMTMNVSAAASYLYEGNRWKALYWSAVFVLNLCILKLK